MLSGDFGVGGASAVAPMTEGSDGRALLASAAGRLAVGTTYAVKMDVHARVVHHLELQVLLCGAAAGLPCPGVTPVLYCTTACAVKVTMLHYLNSDNYLCPGS